MTTSVPSTPDVPPGLQGPPPGWPPSPLPLPPHVVREGEACAAIDRLHLALETTRLAMDAAATARGQVSEDATPATIYLRWGASLLLLEDALARLERHGLATIQAVRTMLALD